ncbi:Lrp/AsnC family transcriptional regulator [Rhodovulum sp. DZ06]|uniref:Lrp/AsnC family transcriptional regulator n=1 Tax=Rhodovulum sp. DZ06 TaxID=3425126 RepID=UPI003D33E256
MVSDNADGRNGSGLDDADRAILRVLQADASLSLERVARKVGMSKTAVWNRIQRLHAAGVILRHTVILDPAKAGIPETFFISVRTNQHDAGWAEKFEKAVQELDQITEAHRLAGEIDYLLKVQVESTKAFDAFYQELIGRISLYSVSSALSMQVMKRGGPLAV